MLSGMKWLGMQLGLTHCAMPSDRVGTLRAAFTDPVHGVIGQKHAVDHILRRCEIEIVHKDEMLPSAAFMCIDI